MLVTEKLSKVTGCHYDWNEDMNALTGRTGSHYGVIAQDVKEIFPEIISMEPDGYYRVDYQQFIPIMIESIKELKAEIEQLKGDA